MLKNLWVSQKRQQAGFPGDRLRGVVSRLFPYSNYKLEMVVVNGLRRQTVMLTPHSMV